MQNSSTLKINQFFSALTDAEINEYPRFSILCDYLVSVGVCKQKTVCADNAGVGGKSTSKAASGDAPRKDTPRKDATSDGAPSDSTPNEDTTSEEEDEEESRIDKLDNFAEQMADLLAYAVTPDTRVSEIYNIIFRAKSKTIVKKTVLEELEVYLERFFGICDEVVTEPSSMTAIINNYLQTHAHVDFRDVFLKNFYANANKSAVTATTPNHLCGVFVSHISRNVETPPDVIVRELYQLINVNRPHMFHATIIQELTARIKLSFIKTEEKIDPNAPALDSEHHTDVLELFSTDSDPSAYQSTNQMPVPVVAPDVARLRHMRDVASRTMEECRDLLKDEGFDRRFKEIHLHQAPLSDQYTYVRKIIRVKQTRGSDSDDSDSDDDSDDEPQPYIRNYTATRAPTNATVTHVISSLVPWLITQNAALTKISMVVIGCSSLVPGGGYEQGQESSEALLCYAGTAASALDQIIKHYSLDANKHSLYIPSCLVFKNPVANYTRMSAADIRTMSVYGYIVPATTKTTAGTFVTPNPQLYAASTHFVDPEPHRVAISRIFNAANFYGKPIILDLQFLVDYRLPVHDWLRMLRNAHNDTPVRMTIVAPSELSAMVREYFP